MNKWECMPVHLDRVKYQMDRPLISPEDLPDAIQGPLPGGAFGIGKPPEPNFLIKMAFVKHSDWAYEKEWRIVCSFRNPCDRYLEFPANVLTGIIFGLRTTYCDRQRIMEAIKTSDRRIKMSEAKEDESQYKVKINRLGP